MTADPDVAMLAAFLDAHRDEVAAAAPDWATYRRQADEAVAYELECLKGWQPKVPIDSPKISASDIDRAVAKLDTADKRAARARLRIPLRGRSPRYGLAALEDEARVVAAAPAGLRNETLNRSAWSLARLVIDGSLDCDDVEDVLVQAGIDAGLDPREARTTVCGALRRRLR